MWQEFYNDPTLTESEWSLCSSCGQVNYGRGVLLIRLLDEGVGGVVIIYKL